jgi:hypothetical protein
VQAQTRSWPGGDTKNSGFLFASIPLLIDPPLQRYKGTAYQIAQLVGRIKSHKLMKPLLQFGEFGNWIAVIVISD